MTTDIHSILRTCSAAHRFVERVHDRNGLRPELPLLPAQVGIEKEVRFNFVEVILIYVPLGSSELCEVCLSSEPRLFAIPSSEPKG